MIVTTVLRHRGVVNSLVVPDRSDGGGQVRVSRPLAIAASYGRAMSW